MHSSQNSYFSVSGKMGQKVWTLSRESYPMIHRETIIELSRLHLISVKCLTYVKSN